MEQIPNLDAKITNDWIDQITWKIVYVEEERTNLSFIKNYSNSRKWTYNVKFLRRK